MTIRRNYECDLCHDPINPDGSNGYGVHFTMPNYLELADVRRVEHHICTRCLTAFQSRPPSPERDKP